MARPVVLLPQPDSPTRPSVSPLLDGEGDAVDGLHRADLALEDDAAREREVHHEVIDLEQRLAEPGRRRSSLGFASVIEVRLLCHYDTFSPFTMLTQHAIS